MTKAKRRLSFFKYLGGNNRRGEQGKEISNIKRKWQINFQNLMKEMNYSDSENTDFQSPEQNKQNTSMTRQTVMHFRTRKTEKHSKSHQSEVTSY